MYIYQALYSMEDKMNHFPLAKAEFKCQHISHRHHAQSEIAIIYYAFLIEVFIVVVIWLFGLDQR